MSSASATDYFPPGLALLGGIPLKSQDLAASIIFTIAYAVIFPLGLWRMFSKDSRTIVLLRPLVFIGIRIACFIIRCVQSTGNYSVGLFVAEQVLLLSGFVALVEPLMSLVEYHVTRFRHPSNPPNQLDRIYRIGAVLLLAALALGIYSGTQYSNINDNPSVLTRVKACRDATVIITLVLTVGAGLVTLFAQLRVADLPWKYSAHLLAISVFLSIPSAYRLELYTNSNTPDNLASGTKAAYYCLSALPEFLGVMLYTVFNLNKEYDIPGAKLRKKQAKILKQNGGVWPEDEPKQETV